MRHLLLFAACAVSLCTAATTEGVNAVSGSLCTAATANEECASSITMPTIGTTPQDTAKTMPLVPVVKSQETPEQRARREEAEKAAEKIKEGEVAPDFTLKDINGNDLSLSSLRGKYVVLDFWGSWCGWCIKGIPQMKEYYTKYAGKFEILGVDCRDTEEKWKNAVAENELPWLHVYNPAEGNVTLTYGIRGFPTKIVVNPEGLISKVILGESEDFYNYLDELFGE